MVFNELFIYFVVVAFSLFGTSKELIGDSQRLCSFVRLQLKSQDNISKQAAVEKKLLTLEKDKEDQSKYYLSYPKPPVLDIKWANRDNNLVEWANIPKFSALDDLVTPLRIFELFFVISVTYQLIRFLATSSCTVEKAGINFEITNEKIRLFLSVLLLTAYHKLLDHKMYWEATPDTFA